MKYPVTVPEEAEKLALYQSVPLTVSCPNTFKVVWAGAVFLLLESGLAIFRALVALLVVAE